MLEVFDQLYNDISLRNYKSFIIEKFYLKNNYYCTRVFFTKQHIEKSYEIESKINDVKINKQVNQIWNYFNKDINEYNNLKNYFTKLITENHKVKIIDPAKHGSTPLWYLKKDLNVGVKLIIIYNKKFEKYFNENSVETINSEKQFRKRDVVFDETGLSLKLPFLENSLVFILPYENASIRRWKIYKNEEGWEGVKCTINFRRFLHPFPKFKLSCKLYNKKKDMFYENIIEIKNDDKLVYKILPPKEKAQEIYKVEAKLYENDKLIDNYTGNPVREIKVNVGLSGDGINGTN
jgi:hypothetical protein